MTIPSGPRSPWVAGGVALLALTGIAFIVGAKLTDEAVHAVALRQTRTLEEIRETLNARFRILLSDAYLLTRLNQELVHRSDTGETTVSPLAASNLEAVAFARGFYPEISLLSSDGRELVRLVSDYNTAGQFSSARIVGTEELRNQSNAPILRGVLRTSAKYVYFSPIEPLVAGPVDEADRQLVMRFGTVLWDEGRSVGALIVTCRFSDLFAAFNEMDAYYDVHTYVLNGNGAFLRGPAADQMSGSLALNERGFAASFPEEWKKMLAADVGEFQTKDGLFTYLTVFPLLAATEEGNFHVIAYGGATNEEWRLLAWATPAELNAMLAPMHRRVLTGWVIAALICVPLAGVAASSFAKARSEAAERKRTYQALRASERRLKDAQEITLLGCWEWNPGRQEMWWSEEVFRLCGWEPGEVEPTLRRCLALCEGPDRPRLTQWFEGCVTATERVIIGCWIRRHDGARRFVELVAHRDQQEDGSSRVLGTMQDVTERVETQRKIQEGEELVESVLNSTLDGIVALRSVRDESGQIADFRFVLVNVAAEEMTGRKGCLLGNHLLKAFPGTREDGLFERYEKVVETGEPQQFEHHYLHDGLDMWLRIVAVRLGDGLVVGLSDISHRKASEAAILRAKEEAEAASQAKGEFLAMMSHEIRTPMNGVLGFADLLADTQLDETQKEFVTIIQSSGSALLRIIDDILDYSRIESGRMELFPILFSPREMLNQVIELLGVKAQGKGLRLKARVDADVPDLICADDGRLRQVLLNLVGNAVKFTDQGEIEVAARMRKGAFASARIEFDVRDTGPGLSEEQIAQLFEPFSQADAGLARRFGGTGLGLAISKRLIGLMGGEIRLTSERGVGSTFSFWIPVGSGKPAEPLGLGNGDGRIGPEFAREFPLKILVVDDESSNRKLLCRMLNGLGYEPAAASSGLEAVRYVEENKPDLVLLDVQMPELDGIETARLIRSDEPIGGAKRYLSAVTASVLQETEANCYRVGIDAFITKPVRRDALLRVLRDAATRLK